MRYYFTLRNLNRVIGIGILLLFVYAFIRLFGPINPAVFKALSVPAHQTFQSGSAITYTASACRYVDINVQTTVIRSLTPVTQPTLQPLPLSTDTTSGTTGCHTVRRQVIIPAATPAGCYRLTIKAIYQVAFYRAPIAREINSNTFCVTVPSTSQQITTLQAQVNALESALQALQQASSGKTTSSAITAPNPASEASTRVVASTSQTAAASTPTSNSSQPSTSPSKPSAPTSLLQPLLNPVLSLGKSAGLF